MCSTVWSTCDRFGNLEVAEDSYYRRCMLDILISRPVIFAYGLTKACDNDDGLFHAAQDANMTHHKGFRVYC